MTTKIKIANKSDAYLSSEFSKYDAILYEKAKKADEKIGMKFGF